MAHTAKDDRYPMEEHGDSAGKERLEGFMKKEDKFANGAESQQMKAKQEKKKSENRSRVKENHKQSGNDQH